MAKACGESLRTGPITGGAITCPSSPEPVGPGPVGSCNIMRQPGRDFRSLQPVDASFCSSGEQASEGATPPFVVLSESSRRRNDLCQDLRIEERGEVAESRSRCHPTTVAGSVGSLHERPSHLQERPSDESGAGSGFGRGTEAVPTRQRRSGLRPTLD